MDGSTFFVVFIHPEPGKPKPTSRWDITGKKRMKRLFMMLMVAIPLVFAGCNKEENPFDEVGSVEELLSFKTIDAWYGANPDDVEKNLVQLGFVKGPEEEPDLIDLPYDGAAYYVLTTETEEIVCQLAWKDGEVLGVVMMKFEPVQSRESFAAEVKRHLQEEQAVYSDRECVKSVRSIEWDDDNDGGIDGGDEYATHEDFVAALERSNHAYLEVSLYNTYSDIRTVVMASYDTADEKLQRIVIAAGRPEYFM